MHHVQAVVEHRRLAEEDEGRTGFKPFVHPFHAFEENRLHFSGAVAHDGTHAAHRIVLEFFGREFGAVLGKEAYFEHRGFHLHLRQFRLHIGNTHNDAAVYITERIQPHQISHGGNAQFALQKLRAFGPHTRQILYACIHRHIYANIRYSPHFS